MIHAHPPGDLAIALGAPFLIPQERINRSLLIRIRAPQAVIGIRANRVQHRIAPRSLFNVREDVTLVRALECGSPMKPIRQPIFSAIVKNHHRRENRPADQCQPILGHGFVIERVACLGAAVRSDCADWQRGCFHKELLVLIHQLTVRAPGQDWPP